MSKNQADQRHLKRIQIMQALFALEFNQDQEFSKDLADEDLDPRLITTAKEIFQQKDELDKQVQQFATERPIEEINKVDLAILRVIVFESKYKKTPKKVLVDEAVELAKEFGSDSSPKFINGVLAKLLMGKKEDKKNG